MTSEPFGPRCDSDKQLLHVLYTDQVFHVSGRCAMQPGIEGRHRLEVAAILELTHWHTLWKHLVLQIF